MPSSQITPKRFIQQRVYSEPGVGGDTSVLYSWFTSTQQSAVFIYMKSHTAVIFIFPTRNRWLSLNLKSEVLIIPLILHLEVDRHSEMPFPSTKSGKFSSVLVTVKTPPKIAEGSQLLHRDNAFPLCHINSIKFCP